MSMMKNKRNFRELNLARKTEAKNSGRLPEQFPQLFGANKAYSLGSSLTDRTKKAEVHRLSLKTPAPWGSAVMHFPVRAAAPTYDFEYIQMTCMHKPPVL